ncbi:MAG: DUF2461 domain-containing protein [Pseudomonadota bacterium]
MSTYTPLPTDLFSFLTELSENNNKPWFEENKPRFKSNVQAPMVGFIEAMAPWFESSAPAFMADTRLNGGSLFRIYRDTRFAKDKTPYKTNVGCHFRHRVGKDAHAPGYYVHIAPDEIFFGGGIWMPPTSVLNQIRDAIVDSPKRWAAIEKSARFKKRFGELRGDQLKRPPRGYDADHPLIEDIKRKSFFAFSSCTPKQVCAKDFPKRIATTFDDLEPLMHFLVDALDVGWD